MPHRLIGDRTASRRTFTVATLMVLMAAATISVTACGGDNPASLSVGGPGVTERTGSISDNHGHVATLTAAQLSAGNAVSLDIRGAADHGHVIGLSGAEVVQIRNSQRVTATSSVEMTPTFGTHFHTVTFN